MIETRRLKNDVILFQTILIVFYQYLTILPTINKEIIIRPEYNFFYAWTDCPLETILSRTRGISGQTSNKTLCDS